MHIIQISALVDFILFRHSTEMIENLEAAGLGFYVRDTQQKLGRR